MRIALERMTLWGGQWTKKRRQEAEARRILKEAESWPLSRCVEILPYVGSVDGHTSGLSDDGKLRFMLALIWLAPFPAHYVSLDYKCEILIPDDPLNGHRTTITYTVRNHKVADTTPSGNVEYIDAGSVKIIKCELVPDSPVNADDLGPAMPSPTQTKLGRTVDIKGLVVTAHAPWKKVRDSEYRPDFSFWVPRW